MLDEGQSIPSVARDLDLTESNLRVWVDGTRADRTHGKTGLTTAERDELARLRGENRVLREEREVLRKAAASSRPSGGEISILSPRRRRTIRSPCCAGACVSRAAASMRGRHDPSRPTRNAIVN